MTQTQQYRTALRHLRRCDTRMADVIKAVGPCKLSTDPNAFRMLTRSIIGQQLSTKAAATIWQRFTELVGDKRIPAKRVVNLQHKQLRSVGLSEAKAHYIADLADKAANKAINLASLKHKTDDQVIQVLTELKGIGVWTAHMFLMFSLGRPDILPTGDLGIANGIQSIYALKSRPTPEQMHEIASSWHPYASIGSWYCWQWLDLQSQGS